MRRTTFASLSLTLSLALPACGDDGAAGGGSSSNGDSTAGPSTTTAADGSSGGDSSSGGIPEPERLQGVADLHLHMFAEEAFGGGWLHGTVEGDGASALGPCDGGNPGDHGRLQQDLAPLIGECPDTTLEELTELVPLVSTIVNGGGGAVGEFIANIPGSAGDTGIHADRTTGFPDFEGWPRWDAVAHQQVWTDQMREAYDKGLRVEVISAVSLDWLCQALPDENVTRPQCNEMDDVILQLEMANAYAEKHDWLEIALTPADARRIVEEDRLAIILSVEASHIMADGDWRPQLDQLYDLGVRTLQPVHQLDNRFGGAAPHNTIFHVAQYAENCHIDYDCALTTPEVTIGFDVDAECRNVKGLTDEGKELVREMLDRGMLVDAAHLSEKSVEDLFEILVEYDYYPFYLSHAHFREVMTPGKGAEEKTTPWWVSQMLRQTRGMVGLRTAHEETSTYEPSPVANTCQGSSRSFAQAYDFGRMGLKVPIGLGSDLNGFIQQTRPRFGPQACSASFPEEAQCQAKSERDDSAPRLGTDFDEKGMAHMGVVLDLVDDLEALGTDVEPLRYSANDWIRMWERVDEERNGPWEMADDIDTSGVTVLPAHGLRRQDFPTECNIPYCPGALLSGDECRFDAQCESGTCEGAGDCGSPTGICQ
ncbi:MAG: membrane dipeptidase [Myxococcota bacterium]